MDHVEELEDYSLPPSNRSPIAKAMAFIIVGCIAAASWRFLGPKSALAGSGWTGDWDQAVQQSRATGKPALILFTADWCPACRQFESEVLSDSKVQQYLNDNFTPVFVDLSDRQGPNNARAQEFGVHQIPTLILYDQGGKEKARGFGAPKETFMLWLKSGGTAIRFQ